MVDEKVTAPVTADATAPHASDSIPVQTSNPEPLVVATEPAPTAEVAPVTPEPVATEGEPDGGDRQGVPKLPDWAQKKLAEAAFSEREAKREAKRLADELAALKAPKPAPAPTPTASDAAAAQQNAPAGGYRTQADFDAAVEAVALQREAKRVAVAQQQQFNAKLDAAWTSGQAAFGEEFATVAQNLNTIGVLPYIDPQGNLQNADLMQMVLETDEPARVLHELGSNPANAAALLQMTPAKRAIEIAKLAVTPSAKKEPTPLSRAPRPVETVEGSARVTAEPRDEDSDEAWFAKRNQELRARMRG